MAGFEEFYRAHLDRARSLAHLITGSRAVAQEVAQDALLAVHDAWDELDNPSAFLRVVVVNRSRSIQRRLIRERLHLSRFVPFEPSTSDPVIDETWHFVRRLPIEQRTIIVLRFYEDLSLVDIAELLDKPVGTVKSSLHRALSRLKENLA